MSPHVQCLQAFSRSIKSQDVWFVGPGPLTSLSKGIRPTSASSSHFPPQAQPYQVTHHTPPGQTRGVHSRWGWLLTYLWTTARNHWGLPHNVWAPELQGLSPVHHQKVLCTQGMTQDEPWPMMMEMMMKMISTYLTCNSNKNLHGAVEVQWSVPFIYSY